MPFSRKTVYLFFIMAGILGLLDTVILLLFFAVSLNLGIVLPGVGGLALLSIGVLKLQNKEIFFLRNPKLKQILMVLSIIGLISFVSVEVLLITQGKSDEGKKVDYLLILGAGLKGQQLSVTLQSRMDRALFYLQAHPDTKVIVSGGQGPDEAITEAEAMKKYLQTHGISDYRIIKEEKATSTMENLRLSREIINTTSMHPQVMIVTSDYHVLRAKMLARRAGLVPYALPAPTPYPVMVNSYLREYFALIKSLILDR